MLVVIDTVFLLVRVIVSHLDITCARGLHAGASSRRVAHSEEDIEGLNKRALCVTTTAVLMPFASTVTQVVENATRQAGGSHVLASSQEGPQLVEEDLRVILLVHSFQGAGQISKAVREAAEQSSQEWCIVGSGSSDSVEHQLDKAGTFGFNGNGDDHEPFLVLGACEGGQDREVVWLSQVHFHRLHFQETGVVP